MADGEHHLLRRDGEHRGQPADLLRRQAADDRSLLGVRLLSACPDLSRAGRGADIHGHCRGGVGQLSVNGAMHCDITVKLADVGSPTNTRLLASVGTYSLGAS